MRGLPENQRAEYKKLTEELQRRGEVSGGSATPPRLASTASPRPQQTANHEKVSMGGTHG